MSDPLSNTITIANTELVSTRDSTHHGYVMLAKTDRHLIVVHRLSYYQAPLGVANEVWHQKLFALTGDVVGSQMPQTVQWSTRSLAAAPRAIRLCGLGENGGGALTDQPPSARTSQNSAPPIRFQVISIQVRIEARMWNWNGKHTQQQQHAHKHSRIESRRRP
jgi:hypothetical protein